MSKLHDRVGKLESRGGGGTIIAVWDDDDDMDHDEPQVHISGTDIYMPLSEFTAKYPDGLLMHIVYDASPPAGLGSAA